MIQLFLKQVKYKPLGSISTTGRSGETVPCQPRDGVRPVRAGGEADDITSTEQSSHMRPAICLEDKATLLMSF